MNIDSEELKGIQRTKVSYKAFSDSTLLSSFLAIINNIIEMGSKMNNIEMAMFTDSIQHWIKSRNKKKSSKRCSPGTIIEVEFGLSYKIETPYRHSALVIKDYQNKVLVVPCTSHKEFVDIAYHPQKRPDGDKNYRLVGTEDNFDHDCVLVLNDIKTVSKNRIISTCGKIDTESENSAYYEIRKIILNDIFSNEIQNYEKEIYELNNTIESYRETVYTKKGIIDSLYRTIEMKEKHIQKLENKSTPKKAIKKTNYKKKYNKE